MAAPLVNTKAAKLTKIKYLKDAPDTVTLELGELKLPIRCRCFGKDKDGDYSVGFGYNEKLTLTVGSETEIVCSIAGKPLGRSVVGKNPGKKASYYFGGKVDIQIGENLLTHQVGINITIPKSDKWTAPIKDATYTCTIGVNVTAVGSKSWEEGGDCTPWQKQPKPKEDEEDNDDDEDEEEEEKKPAKKQEKEKKKPRLQK